MTTDAPKRRPWALLKWLLVLAILAAVGWQFYGDLTRPELAELSLRPGWLVLSAVLYLFALATSAWYWHHLLHTFGDRPRFLTSLRAYFAGHLGKYVPGKAWALLLRGGLVRGPEVRFGVAILTSFYEVLTTMAAGALVAALVFAVNPPVVPGWSLPPYLTGLLLLAVCGVPLLPGVFNRVVVRLARRFENVESFKLPTLRFGTLLVGLVSTGAGWGLMGLSVWAALQAVLPEPPALSAESWLHLCATIALAYVAGFLIVFMPGGVGVREFFLLRLLKPVGPEGLVAVTVLLLRLAWTAAELLAAGVLFWAGPRPPRLGGDVANQAVARVD